MTIERTTTKHAQVYVHAFQVCINTHEAAKLLVGLSPARRHVHPTSGYFHQYIDDVFRARRKQMPWKWLPLAICFLLSFWYATLCNLFEHRLFYSKLNGFNFVTINTLISWRRMVTDVQETHALGQIILLNLSMSFLPYYNNNKIDLFLISHFWQICRRV